MANSIEEVVVKLLEQQTSKEVEELRNMILRRIATETTIQPARVPAPLNITEIGGYYNLLRRRETMQYQLLASILGLPYASNG